jgi:hypothetical protein
MVTAINEQFARSPHIVETIFRSAGGLAKAGVAGVFNRALCLHDRRKALETWT